MASLLRVSSGRILGDFDVRFRTEEDASEFPDALRPEILRKRLQCGRGISLSLLLKLLKRCCILLRDSENLVTVEAPCVVFGDLHGQLHDFLKMYDAIGQPPSATNRFLFLGDYVDRGEFSVELITFILALKLSYPEHVVLLRGNHECEEITSYYGFMDDCVSRYGRIVYDHFLSIFNAMPMAAVLKTDYGSWFCVHGGLPPTGIEEGIENLNRLDRFQEPDPYHKDAQHVCLFDMLWADPLDCTEYCDMTNTERDCFKSDEMAWLDNESRGCSHVYGVQPLKKFLSTNNLRGVLRGHEFQEDGIGRHFHHEELKKLVMPNGDIASPLPPVLTIFSASNYCGRDGNTGAFVKFGMDSSSVDIARFDPVEDDVIDSFLEQGKLEQELEEEEEKRQLSMNQQQTKTADSTNEASPSQLMSSTSSSMMRKVSSRRVGSVDSVKMNSFHEASYLIKSFMGVNSKTTLLKKAKLYEQYKLKSSGETRKKAHSKQLWKWAKAKLKQNSAGRFKLQHQFKDLMMKKLVLKVTKKKIKGNSQRSTSELKPSFRENILQTQIVEAHDLSVLNKNELRAVHLCYDMWDISSSCEVTDDDLVTFYNELGGSDEEISEENKQDQPLYEEMADVVRILAADSFHITASDFLQYAVVMKQLEKQKNVPIVGEGEGEGEGEGSAKEEEGEEEELRTTSVFAGWEIGWVANDAVDKGGSFYYSKDGVSIWDLPTDVPKMTDWEAVLDPTSTDVYYYNLIDGSVSWDAADIH